MLAVSTVTRAASVMTRLLTLSPKCMQVMVIPDRPGASQSSLSTRQSLKAAFSTKILEPSPGDMLRDPAMVYAQAEETAKRFRSMLQHTEALAPGQQPDVAQHTEALKLLRQRALHKWSRSMLYSRFIRQTAHDVKGRFAQNDLHVCHNQAVQRCSCRRTARHPEPTRCG